MKVLGAVEGAGAWVELLLLLLLPPNRLWVGVEDDEVMGLVVLAGLLVIKENAGFGAAAAGSVGKKKVLLVDHKRKPFPHVESFL